MPLLTGIQGDLPENYIRKWLDVAGKNSRNADLFKEAAAFTAPSHGNERI